jgi:hypothetical protein
MWTAIGEEDQECPALVSYVWILQGRRVRSVQHLDYVLCVDSYREGGSIVSSTRAVSYVWIVQGRRVRYVQQSGCVLHVDMLYV